jgi:mRNA interferase HigB
LSGGFAFGDRGKRRVARADFPHADPVDKFTVFNIKKSEYRLITVVHYNRFKVYVRAVLTHEEYDKGKWKDD